jgi:hypothetical protein
VRQCAGPGEGRRAALQGSALSRLRITRSVDFPPVLIKTANR